MPGDHDVMLKKLRRHSHFDEQDIEALQTLPMTRRDLSTNEDFVRQGDKPEVSALVVGGMVARYHLLSNGKRQYISFHLPGDLPDLQSLFIERMDHAACSIGLATVALIPHNKLCDLFEQRPQVGFALWRETLIDAAIFREAITNNSSRPPTARLAHLFCELYYRARVAGVAKLGSCVLPFHQGQIGEALAMSIVTVNRTMQALRRTGAVQFGNGVLRILDWGQLVEVGDFSAGYLHLRQPPRLRPQSRLALEEHPQSCE